MSFPTHDMLDGISKLLYFQSLETRLRERAPELADRIERPDISPFYLKVRLEGGTGVVLSPAKIGGHWVWGLIDPGSRSSPRVWSLHTPAETLVKALHVRATARLARTREPSPWCWDEREESALTELADLLTVEGLEVQSVVVENRDFVLPGAAPYDPAIHTAQRADGAFLTARLDRLNVRVALKHSLGWTADIRHTQHSDWQRLDLRHLMTGHRASLPGIAPDAVDVQDLAKSLAAATDELRGAPTGGRASSPRLADALPTPGARARHSGFELADSVAAQLRAMTFGDIEATRDPNQPLRSDILQVVWWDRPRDLGLQEIQRLNGRAATEEKKLLVIVGSHITRPAEEFSDRAKAFVFYLDSSLGWLFGGNERGTESYLPGWTDWAMKRAQPDRRLGL